MTRDCIDFIYITEFRNIMKLLRVYVPLSHKENTGLGLHTNRQKARTIHIQTMTGPYFLQSVAVLLPFFMPIWLFVSHRLFVLWANVENST
jgi:hypothetical protein